VTALKRLMGLETEYAVRFRSAVPESERPSDYSLFQRLLTRLGKLLPTAEAVAEEPGRFLATGGAIRFERFWQAGKSGLVEGATPECRSPRDLLIWQRAQDRLLSEAARKAGEPDGEFVLLKNNRDSQHRTYGSHENYEAEFVAGPHRFLFRAGLILLLPLVLVEWLVLFLVLVPVLLTFWLIASGWWLAASLRAARRGKTAPPISDYVGEGLFTDDKHVMPWPLWFEPAIMFVLVATLLPLSIVVAVLLRLFAFRRQRRFLLPFLLTRPVVAGTGWLDSAGKFHIAQKAPAINRLCGFYALYDRPIFSFGNLLEAVILLPLSRHRFRGLFNTRQRMQICHGDSNRCEEAEYLRLATTALVLDAIEAGRLRSVPRIWPPLRTMKRICRDVSLSEIVGTFRGRKLTAVDVQRFYLNVCREYVTELTDAPSEAWDVLERWDDVLTRLEDDRESLLGRVDWITKRFLLDAAGKDLPPEARRKIDLRYHEVSPAGYFEQLKQAGVIRTLVSDAEVEQAMRNAPSATPAAVRGRYIREFADGDVPLRVDWQNIQLGEGKSRRIVELQPPANDANPD